MQNSITLSSGLIFNASFSCTIVSNTNPYVPLNITYSGCAVCPLPKAPPGEFGSLPLFVQHCIQYLCIFSTCQWRVVLIGIMPYCSCLQGYDAPTDDLKGQQSVVPGKSALSQLSHVVTVTVSSLLYDAYSTHAVHACRDTMPLLTISRANNVWFQGVSIIFGVTTNSTACLFSLIGPGKEYPDIVCPGVYIISSYGIQINQVRCCTLLY